MVHALPARARLQISFSGPPTSRTAATARYLYRHFLPRNNTLQVAAVFDSTAGLVSPAAKSTLRRRTKKENRYGDYHVPSVARYEGGQYVHCRLHTDALGDGAFMMMTISARLVRPDDSQV